MITTFKELVAAVKEISPAGEYVSVIIEYNFRSDGSEKLQIHVYSEITSHCDLRENFQEAFDDYKRARNGVSNQSPLEVVDAEPRSSREPPL